jgi:lysophospholipase L1-like esterase
MPIIVALGDSTTAGTPGFASPLEAPPDGRGDATSQYAYWLTVLQPEWRVLNRGVNGERTDQIRARLRRDVLGVGADVVVIIAGVNDIYPGFPAGAVHQELEAMYELARSDAHLGVVCGSILPYNTASAAENARMRAVNTWIREHCVRHERLAFCDTRAAVAALDDPDRLASSPDGLHPSPQGYRLMADALEPVIRRMLSAERALR